MSSQAHESALNGAQANEFHSDAYSEYGVSWRRGLAAPKHKAFYTDSTPTRYAPSRDVDVEHVRLELALDPAVHAIAGTAVLRFRPLTDVVRELTLDAVDMQLGAITLNDGPTLTSSYDGARLLIRFAEPLSSARSCELTIPYEVNAPRAGMYFTGPDEHAPNKPREIWTQGQDEDSRYWYPCFDSPNERLTSETILLVPEQYTTLSNGRLLSCEPADGSRRRWHWLQDKPHVSYLVMIAVGEWELVEDQWDGIPVNYYCYPGDRQRAKNAFGQTPQMVKFFSEKIGVRYPWDKYAQVPATDFIFGGMENTTATIQTETTLHDDRAHLDFSSNPLVSHELAHQWFGDMLTCRDWSHGWLNEGFTTYMECCWIQHELGDVEFQYYMLNEMEGYLQEDASSYRRPLVCNRYEEPIDVFDRHLYEKGACVQHMLRFMLGETLFWKALKHYTERHAFQPVITQHWQTAIEDVTGRNMDEFFAQFVYGAGHPDLKLAFRYDRDAKLACVTLTQTQKPDAATHTSIYKLPIDLRLTAGGGHRTHRLLLSEGEQTFYIPQDAEPDFITLDPGNWILKTLDLAPMPEGMLIKQLEGDTDGVARVHAARELGKRATHLATQALIRVMNDRAAPWYVQGECAKALSVVGTPDARDALIGALDTPHPKALRAAVKALGSFPHQPSVADALLAKIERGDASWFVEAECFSSLGATRDSRAGDVLRAGVVRNGTHNDVIPVAAMDGLVALQDPAQIDVLRLRARPGTHGRTRLWAMSNLGSLARLAEESVQTQVRQELEEYLLDRDFFAQLGAVAGLKNLGSSRAVGALRKRLPQVVDGRLKGRISKAIESLSAKDSGSTQNAKLRDEIDVLRKSNRDLLNRIEKLEARSTQAAEAQPSQTP